MSSWHAGTRIAFILLVVLILAVSLAPLQRTSTAAASSMVVTFIDVGQGVSIWIQAPSGEDMLVDGGPSTNASRDYLLSHGTVALPGALSTPCARPSARAVRKENHHCHQLPT